MSNLSNLPTVDSLINSRGTVVDFDAYGENKPLGRSLRRLQKADEEPQYNDADLEKFNATNSFAQVIADLSTAPVASGADTGQVLVKPPANAFEGIARKMVKITSDGGFLKLITVYGSQPECPVHETDYVTFSYSGWLDGRKEPFTSSYYQRKPVERQIGGVGPVFEGLDIALMSMKKGESAFFLTCPSYSYGVDGTREEENWPAISPNDWILWKIEVKNVIAASDYVTDIFDLTPDDRSKKPFYEILDAVQLQRQRGLEAFKNHQLLKAKKCFERAAKLLVEPHILTENQVVEKKNLLSKLFCNIAVTTHKIDEKEPESERNYEDVYESAASAVNFDETNARAWYWGGLALRHLYRLDESLEYLKKAAKLDPRNAEIGAELRALEKDYHDQKDRENKILKKMVGVDEDGKVVRRIPVAIEKAVPASFRTLITGELEALKSQGVPSVHFDLSCFNKQEIAYVNAAIACYENFHVRRFKSELGSEIVFIESK